MSKHYFGTDGIRGRVGEDLINPEFVLKLGWAVGRVLEENFGKSSVLIGKDTRISGYLLESVLEAGLSAAGVNACMLGPIPTPAVAFLTRTFRAQAGIVISASHNPYYDNGVKIFSSEGTKLSKDFEVAIEAKLAQPMQLVEAINLGKARRITDASGRYIEFCKGTVDLDNNLYGLKIVLDCAHGATYVVAPSVFRELGAEVIELGTDPNGLNINAGCGSTHPEKLAESVKAEEADLGIAFDGDGDRVIMVDHKGEVVDGDELLFIIASCAFVRGTLGGGVVGTVMSNLGLEESLGDLGIAFKRTAVGDRHVLEAMRRYNWVLGGEPSGHIACLDRTTTGDGLIAALRVLNAICHQGKSLHTLKGEMKKYPQILVNIPCAHPESACSNQAVEQVVSTLTKDLGSQGRVLVRPSGTEPVVRVMVEGRDRKLVAKFARELVTVIENTVA